VKHDGSGAPLGSADRAPVDAGGALRRFPHGDSGVELHYAGALAADREPENRPRTDRERTEKRPR